MKLAGKRKITEGHVIQTYNDKGKCIKQEFDAGDQVDWVNEEGSMIPVPKHEYQPFNMVQPLIKIPVIGTMGEDGQVKFKEPKNV